MSDDFNTRSEGDFSTDQQSKEGRIAEKVIDTLEKRKIEESEQVSRNAKVIILGLFVLVGFLTSMFTFATVWGVEVNDQMAQVFYGAITGAFTLGGVLITQLWGKNRGVT